MGALIRLTSCSSGIGSVAANSVWSVIGLPIALLIGMDGFRRLLAGGYAMDLHFQRTPLGTKSTGIAGTAGGVES